MLMKCHVRGMAEHSSFRHNELIPEEKQVEIGLKIKEIMTEVETTKNPRIRELLRLEASEYLREPSSHTATMTWLVRPDATCCAHNLTRFRGQCPLG
jgi:hypothetical protein